MSPRVADAMAHEWRLAVAEESAGRPAVAFHHLERAHILSQRSTIAHVRTHLRMAGWAWRHRKPRELFGQATRIAAAALFSRLWVPVGNTGGANVSAIRPMPMPADLERLLVE